MSTATQSASHLAAPFQRLLVRGTALFAVAAALVATAGSWMPADGVGRSIGSLLPGVVLAAWLFLLYDYLRQYDELLRGTLLKSLAVSALTGIVVLFTSMLRVGYLGYAPFPESVVLGAMGAGFAIAATVCILKFR